MRSTSATTTQRNRLRRPLTGVPATRRVRCTLREHRRTRNLSPLTALNALHRARYKLLDDASGPNLGPLTEAEKGNTRTLKEILLQDCGRRTVKISVKKPDASSKYKGVSFDRKSQAWHTSFSVNGKMQYFGTYDTEEQAAKACDWCVRERHAVRAALKREDSFASHRA